MDIPRSHHVYTHLDNMFNEWFPKTYSLEQAKKFIVISVNTTGGKLLRERTSEVQEEFTPLFLFRKLEIFGGYEVDYELVMHKSLSLPMTREAIFTGVALSYLSSGFPLNFENAKWYPRDNMTKNTFNTICDYVKEYYYRSYASS